MYCHQCGKSLPASSSFCPSCGAPATGTGFAAAATLRTMYRPQGQRMLAGVCAAFALRYRWDLTATRIITVLLGVLIFPVMEVAYIVGWMLIPEEVPLGMQAPYAPPPPPAPPVPPSNPQTY
jgi:phage shock protein C